MGVPLASTRRFLLNRARRMDGTTVNRNDASPMFDFARSGAIKEIGLDAFERPAALADPH